MRPHSTLSYMRCVAESWDSSLLMGSTSQGPVAVDISGEPYLQQLLRTGMQLNLLDSHSDGHTIKPGLIVVEPDYLLDISAIAACFQDYGHHPLSYLLQRLKPRANTQAILLGNLASGVLDDVINQPDYNLARTLRNNFRQQALQFCTCPGFNAQHFKQDAARQSDNIREAVRLLFEGDAGQEPIANGQKPIALLEPSFVCEHLGVQGRADLMTSDMRLLVEQKSGKNWNIECPQGPGRKSLQRDDHYVQLLLYYGVLRYNFQRQADHVDMRLLYSKYPANKGLVAVSYHQALFHEAIRLRNRIVAQETAIARHGFRTLLPHLHADQLLEQQQRAQFFHRYIRGQADAVFQLLHRLSPVEQDYAERMLTFIFREQQAQKVGVPQGAEWEGQAPAQADLWNMPLAQKRDTGNIFTGLTISSLSQSAHQGSYDLVELSVPVSDDDYFLPNFRRGDMVYLYRYDQAPDVRQSILYKGVIQELSDTRLTLLLNDGQQNAAIFAEGTYAVEHASSDIGSTSALRSVMAFCAAPQERRDVLLGLRPPERDATLTLTRSYHPHYDDILLQSKQARHYFLLQGPPGTGKTSMALRFLVQEELADGGTLLLMSYTNRAVDEICAMLTTAHIDYLRLGSPASCDPRYADHLLDRALSHYPRLSDMQDYLSRVRVVTGTTSTLQSRPFLFQLKAFSLAIVDEASQLLEPHLIGLLSSERIRRFILIGDHKQLPAVIQQPDDEPRLSECRLSLFERLLRHERQSGRTAFTAILRRQGRMHPDIAAFPNRMFYSREQLECVPCEHQIDTSLHYDLPAEDDLDQQLRQRRVLFLPSTLSAPPSSAAPSDKVNPREAYIVADLLRRIHRQYGPRFDPDHTVGVIVPYRNQISMIRRAIAQLNIPPLLSVSIDTVERYQGSQRDVIIYSFTVQQPYQLRFLTATRFLEDGMLIDRKLNVVMTRARQQLLMTGCPDVLMDDPLFARLISDYQASL